MAPTNHDKVGIALGLLNKGMLPFIERELKSVYGDRWLEEANLSIGEDRVAPKKKKGATQNWDTQAILTLVWNLWREVFNNTLGHTDRAIVSELREVRNKWAHQEAFSTREASRVMDSISMLLKAVSAEEAVEADRMHQELNRLMYEEQARGAQRTAAKKATDGEPTGSLKGWRHIITPHADVAKGAYQQAEFAADLAQVYRGDATSEYGDPVDFYSRTFLTAGLKDLLIHALRRVSKTGGAPVLKLQTNFGGGKTHSMLALFHIFSGINGSKLPGIEPILKEAAVTDIPTTKRAVLVGTALSPAQPRKKDDGTVVNTLWGELAWQIAGKKGFKLLEDSDKTGINPGSDVLRELFKLSGPCVILIDEWVAYIRLLKDDLPGGSFDSNVSFAQSLTEAAAANEGTLVVASLPMSDIEQGGEAGKEALRRIEHVFDRIDTPWRPASSEEGFEIVRRRMFETITDPEKQKQKDAVVREFYAMYSQNQGEFPGECRESGYKKRMEASYPIHPELFDRLFKDWSELERFQRTRGVLRLMAEVIQTLWERGDDNLMIMPSMVPIDEHAIQAELMRYLDPVWDPVIEGDVDGPNSLPFQIDNEVTNLGRYSACRRVARTIYLGSAPTLGKPKKGLEDKQIKLGCAQPGESVAIFGDALRRLSDKAHYLYVDGSRYWYATQPSVTRLAMDRAEEVHEDTVFEEIRKFVRMAAAQRGELSRVHVCPVSSGEIPDEHEARLIVLGPEYPHILKEDNTPARQQAIDILDNRGSSPRQYRNTLVFLAPDRKRMDDLTQAVKYFIAWEQIYSERLELNLDPFQVTQSDTKRQAAKQTVIARIPETYNLLMVPEQDADKNGVKWIDLRLQAEDHLVVRAIKKLRNEELLCTELAGNRLRLELDKIPLWRGNHVKVQQLIEDFAKYLYLPRILNPSVIIEAIRDGVGGSLYLIDDVFGYASEFNEEKDRYVGLRFGQSGNIVADKSSVLVRPDVTRNQLDAESQAKESKDEGATTKAGANGSNSVPASSSEVEVKEESPKRFYGTVDLDYKRISRDADSIAREIVHHLALLDGAVVKVSLEIQAELPNGVSHELIRTVAENCRTLKFTNHGFEKE